MLNFVRSMMTLKSLKISSFDLALLSIFIGGSYLRLTGLGDHSFVNNELYIMLHFDILESGFQNFISSFYRWEIHPPLNHLLMYFWGKIFGFQEFEQRLLAALLGVGSLFFTYKIGTIIGGKHVGLYSLCFLALNYPSIALNRLATSYGWQIFFSSLALYLLLEINQRIKQNLPYRSLLVTFVFILILMSYVHYVSFGFAVFLILMLITPWTWTGKNKSKLFVVFTFLAGFGPWLPVLIRQYPRVGTHDYSRELGNSPLKDYLFYCFNNSWVIVGLFFASIAYFVYKKRTLRITKNERILVATALIPILTVYSICLVSTPIWNVHYYALLIPFFAVLAALSISLIPQKRIAYLFVVFYSSFSIWGLYNGSYESRYPIRISIREMVQEVHQWNQSHFTSPPPVFNHSWSSYVFDHYFRENESQKINYIVPNGRLDLFRDPANFSRIDEVMSQSQHNHFWLLNTYNPINIDLKSFLEANYELEKKFNNQGCKAYLYKRKNI